MQEELLAHLAGQLATIVASPFTACQWISAFRGGVVACSAIEQAEITKACTRSTEFPDICRVGSRKCLCFLEVVCCYLWVFQVKLGAAILLLQRVAIELERDVVRDACFTHCLCPDPRTSEDLLRANAIGEGRAVLKR